MPLFSRYSNASRAAARPPLLPVLFARCAQGENDSSRQRLMPRRTLCFLLAACVWNAWAEGPGSRLLTTPEVPQPTQRPSPTEPRQTAACERMRDEMRERCLRQERQHDIDNRSVGAGATGMGSGAGMGGVSGPSAGPNIGGGTPRE